MIITLNLIEQIAYLHFVQFFWDFNLLLCLNIFSVSFFCLIPVQPAVYWPQKSLGWCLSTGCTSPKCQYARGRNPEWHFAVLLFSWQNELSKYCTSVCSQGESQLSPTSPRKLCQDQQAGLTQVCFQISACVLGLRVCETLHAPLESGVCVPIALQLSCVQVPLAFQASHPGARFPSAGPQAGKSNVGPKPLRP